MPAFLGEARDEISEQVRKREGKAVGSRGWYGANSCVAKAYRRAAHRSDKLGS